MERIFKYIVYQTINLVNNKIYIGVHQIANLDFDGYIGCGVYINKPHTYLNPKTLFQKAVKKYGTSKFRRTTLKVFDNLEDALDLERWLVDEQFCKNPDTYNMILGGKQFIPTNTKQVYIYDKAGNYIKMYNSLTEAALFIYNRKNISCISRAIKNGYFCKQYQVSNVKYDYMKDYVTYKQKIKKNQEVVFKNKKGIEQRFSKPKKIAQFDVDDNLIKIFNSIGEAKKSGFTNVQSVLEGKRNKCKGFYFKYYED